MSSRAALSLTIDPRGQSRHKVFLPAEMMGAAGSSRVHLLNLSSVGALIHGDAVPRPGEVVRFRCATETWMARVVWAQHKRFGVVHIAPLGLETLAALGVRQAA